MADKLKLDFTEIAHRIRQMDFPQVDAVVGIATGGTVPASLVAYQLDKPLYMIHINYRAPDNSPQRDAPAVLAIPDLPSAQSTVLLVDDVSVSGKTLEAARSLLNGHTVMTFVLKGQGDYVAFTEIETCVAWPWNP